MKRGHVSAFLGLFLQTYGMLKEDVIIFWSRSPVSGDKEAVATVAGPCFQISLPLSSAKLACL